MGQATLDVTGLKTRNEFFDMIRRELEYPSIYSNTLNGLHDFIGVGMDSEGFISELERPYVINVLGYFPHTPSPEIRDCIDVLLEEQAYDQYLGLKDCLTVRFS